MKNKLAIFGGPKIRTKPFPFYNTIDKKEMAAVAKVLETGVLSKYLGSWHEDFYGGEQVRALEKEWSKYFKVKHAISVNSATSGLICAVGAAGVEPGDEVIVSPYSMVISATAPLFYGAIPVFADVEKDFFCLDPDSIKKKITKKTKAIIAVDIFGQPYNADKINKIAKKHNLIVIEDCAQAPGAIYHGKHTGTLGDLGVFSLNYHKHIHSGEGGIIVTNNDKMAERLRLIRNHAEAVVEKKGVTELCNMLGFNFRMTEIEAAISRQQLKKLKHLLNLRIKNVEYLRDQLKPIPFITAGLPRKGARHVYYMQTFKFNEKLAGVKRDEFLAAVKAELAPVEKRKNEGILINSGYTKPLYLLPIFQKKICFGKKGYPFISPFNRRVPNYQLGLCPVTEKLFLEEIFLNDYIKPNFSKKDLNDVVKAFLKVANNINELKAFPKIN